MEGKKEKEVPNAVVDRWLFDMRRKTRGEVSKEVLAFYERLEKMTFAELATYRSRAHEDDRRVIPEIRQICAGGAEVYGDESQLRLLRFMSNVARKLQDNVCEWLAFPQPRFCEYIDHQRSAAICASFVETELGVTDVIDKNKIPSFGDLYSDVRFIAFLQDLDECLPAAKDRARLAAAFTICAARTAITPCGGWINTGPYPFLDHLDEADLPQYFSVLKSWASAALSLEIDAAYVPRNIGANTFHRPSKVKEVFDVLKNAMTEHKVVTTDKVSEPAKKKARVAK